MNNPSCLPATHRGNLPPNLHVQRRARRFDPEGDHRFDRTTAWPGASTVMVNPEARKKYRDHVPEERDPWVNSYADVVQHKEKSYFRKK